MTKPFLIIQLRPEDETADNELESICRYGGLNDSEVVRVRLEKTTLPRIDLKTYSAIIVGGSPFDISTPQQHKRSVQQRIEADFASLFDQIVPADFPFLGCCSGNGLLGNYCGASISNRYAEPVGGVDVYLTEDGKRDALLMDFPNSFRVLTGHKEACDNVPADCVLLATNSSCPVQMFRLKNNMYAAQFHPEADAKGFAVRINIYKNHGYFPADTANDLIDSVNNESTPFAQLILKRFVEMHRV